MLQRGAARARTFLSYGYGVVYMCKTVIRTYKVVGATYRTVLAAATAGNRKGAAAEVGDTPPR